MKMLGSKAAGKIDNDFLFTGKELETDLGLDQYDFGARHYDAQIGRFHQIDPMPDHPNNISTSTYAYCINNPVNLIDPDGMNWTMSAATDDKGNTTVTFTFTGAVLNQSSTDYSKKMGKIVANMKSEIENNFSGGEGNLKFKTVANLRSIDNESELKSDEHIIRIADEVQDDFGETTGVSGKSDLFGKEVFIGTTVADNIYKGKDKTTTSHEIGHTGGLFHPDWNYFNNGSRDKSNFITNYFLGLWQRATGQIMPDNGNAQPDGKTWKENNLMYRGNNDPINQNKLNGRQFQALQNAIKWKLVNRNTVDNKMNHNL